MTTFGDLVKRAYNPNTTGWSIVHMFVFMGAGLAANFLFGGSQAEALAPGNEFYLFALYAVLGVGIYGSVYAIDLSKLAQDRSALLLVITLGVTIKIAIIGTIVFYGAKALALNVSPIVACMYAIIVAQIDPLSVSALTSNRPGFSERAKNFLFVWSSFDDPMTVVFASVIAVLGASAIAGGVASPEAISQSLLQGGGATFLGNFAVAGACFLINRIFGLDRRPGRQVVLLLVGAAVAVYFGYILAIALLGLFLRPDAPWFRHAVEALVPLAYTIALVLLGSNLIESAPVFVRALMLGSILAVGAVAAQVIAATLFGARLAPKEKAFLRWAQQNGVTAVILALYLSEVVAGTPAQAGEIIGTVAVAILLINLIHMLAFWRLERRATVQGLAP